MWCCVVCGVLCSAVLDVRKDAGQDERVLVWACWSLTAHSLSTRQTLLVTSLAGCEVTAVTTDCPTMPGRSGGRGGAQPPVQQKPEKTLSDKQTVKEDSRDSGPPSQPQVSRGVLSCCCCSRFAQQQYRHSAGIISQL